MPKIQRLTAREILDSRGRPTVLAKCWLENSVGEASVPSGASTGAAEALELRDGDPNRYGGLGCHKAVANIEGEISQALCGIDLPTQTDLDARMLALDTTPGKSRLGANAILAVSLAFARAVANSRNLPLWRYFSELLQVEPNALPRLTINLFSGGKHAGQQVPVQDVLIVPLQSCTIDETLTIAYDVFQAAAVLSQNRYNTRLLRADEGGLAPPFNTAEEMLQMAVDAISSAGYSPGEQIALAVDVAASHFYRGGRYTLGSEELSSREMITRLERWVGDYPIMSLEDGLAENDWQYWPLLMARLGHRVLIVGDDLLCTQPVRIRKAIEMKAANALLLKVNQIGTLTEAAEAWRVARLADWLIVLSVRSGETEDTWAADLAVGWCANQFKNGSITQSERLAKLNRLLEIEQSTGLPVTPWPNAKGIGNL
jgi:enolase